MQSANPEVVIVSDHELLKEIGTTREGKKIFTAPFAEAGTAASLEPQTLPDLSGCIHAQSCTPDRELLTDSERKK
jgi:hypothetical protein